MTKVLICVSKAVSLQTLILHKAKYSEKRGEETHLARNLQGI